MAEITIDEIESLADDIVKEHSTRDQLFDRLEDYYFQEGSKNPLQKHEQEGIEKVCLPHGSNAVELVQDLLSDTELTITVPAKKDTDPERSLADASEVYLDALLADSARSQGQALLSRAAWLTAMRGGLAGGCCPCRRSSRHRRAGSRQPGIGLKGALGCRWRYSYGTRVMCTRQ